MGTVETTQFLLWTATIVQCKSTSHATHWRPAILLAVNLLCENLRTVSPASWTRTRTFPELALHPPKLDGPRENYLNCSQAGLADHRYNQSSHIAYARTNRRGKLSG